MQMIDVHLPTTDGRSIILSRYTQPEADLQLLLKQLKLQLPEQPPPKITASHRLANRALSADFLVSWFDFERLTIAAPRRIRENGLASVQ
jgi:hypothetical protein